MNTFILINFIIAFISDLLLNVLSRQPFSPKYITSLYSYFEHYKSPILTGIYAGITVITVLIITMTISHYIFNFSTPSSYKDLYKFLILSFILGYIADILIFKLHIFGTTLDKFYSIAGAGFGGAISLVFCVIVSYLILSTL